MLNIVGDLLFSLPVKNQLGEGVQWYCETQSIWWLDIEGACLLAIQRKIKRPQNILCLKGLGVFVLSKMTSGY